MRLPKMRASEFWTNAAAAGGAGVAGAWVAQSQGCAPDLVGGLAAGVGGSVAAAVLGVKLTAREGDQR